MIVNSLKRKIALILLAVFILTSYSFNVIAADAQPWTGSNDPSFRGYGSGTYANNSTQAKYATITRNYKGVFGKVNSDKVYKVVSEYQLDPSATLSANPDKAGDFYLNDLANLQKRKDVVFEFDIAFDSTGSSITTYGDFYTDSACTVRGKYANYTYNKFSLSPTNAVIGRANNSKAISLDIHKWYNVAVVFDFEENERTDGDTYTHRLFINGDEILNKTETSASTTYYGVYVFRMSMGASHQTAYFDNLRCYNIDDASSFNTIGLRSDVITSSSVDVNISGNTIKYKPSSKVSDVISAIQKKNDTNLRIYNSSHELLTDDAELTNSGYLVVAAKNGTDYERAYSYYTLTESVYEYGNNLYDGSIDVLSGGGTVDAKINIPGLYGKATSDFIYKLNDEYGNPYVSLGNYAYSSSGLDTCEFSFMIPETSGGADIEFGMVTSGSGQVVQPLLITKNGLYASSSELEGKICDLKPLTWYNMAIVSPGAVAFDSDGKPTEYSHKMIIYLNGVKVKELTHSAATAYRHFRLNGKGNTDFYLDNLRRIAGDYVPAFDAVPTITQVNTTYRFEDNTFVLESNPSVSEFLSGINAPKSILRVCNAAGAVMEDNETIVSDSCYLVAAAKNGTNIERAYSYYPIKHDKYSVEIIALRDGERAGNYYDDSCELEFSAKFNNFDGSLYKATFYVAQYKNNELIKLWNDDTTLSSAGTSDILTVDISDMPKDRKGTSIKLMLVNSDTLEPYCAPKTMRYSYADTKATLFIIGDSVAQTYEINAENENNTGKSPFIQGWGYHIGSFLNNSITVDNRARSGWDSDRFLYPDGVYTKEDGVDSAGTKLLTTNGAPKRVDSSEKYKCWPTVKTLIKPGDFVIIALGINDMGSANVPKERFKENLTVMCRDAQKAGASVIFSTPTARAGSWDADWSFSEEYKNYGDIACEVAMENSAICIQTGAALVSEFNSLYNEYNKTHPGCTSLEAKRHVRKQFHIYDAVFNAPESEGGYGMEGTWDLDDCTHFHDKGSKRLTEIIATLISKSNSTLADYVIFD